MGNGFVYCQSREELNVKCKKQCVHCKRYYEPLEKSRLPRKIKKKNNGKLKL